MRVMIDVTQRLTRDAACQGCGVDAAVIYEDLPLCGSCFYIASLTAMRRAKRLVETSDADRDAASMIARLVQSLRDGR